MPDATKADAALLVVAGRPGAIPHKGVERACRWLEDETDSMRLRSGEFLLESGRLGALVLLSGAGDPTASTSSWIARESKKEERAHRPRPTSSPTNVSMDCFDQLLT